MPKAVPSMVRPTASAKAPLPSASIVTAAPALAFLLHAPITKASLTAVQTISSTPFALISSALSKKPGRCFGKQGGVKAQGTEMSADLRRRNKGGEGTSV